VSIPKELDSQLPEHLFLIKCWFCCWSLYCCWFEIRCPYPRSWPLSYHSTCYSSSAGGVVAVGVSAAAGLSHIAPGTYQVLVLLLGSTLLLVYVPVPISMELDSQVPEHLFLIKCWCCCWSLYCCWLESQGAGLSATRTLVTYPVRLLLLVSTGLSSSVHIQGSGLSATIAPVTYQVLVLLLGSPLLLV
jgi:hypothetical protein